MDIGFNRNILEKKVCVYESAKLTFIGVDRFDVYNPSIPFLWKGTHYIFGRVQRRQVGAPSWTRLFKNIDKDVWALVPDSLSYPIEDPFVSKIRNNLILGGNHLRLMGSENEDYRLYFYKGVKIDVLNQFTMGPYHMKSIRLIDYGKKIGIFTRLRKHRRFRRLERCISTFICNSFIGYTEIENLNSLNAKTIAAAKPINDLFKPGQWGGCDQAILLEDGKIGIIGHIGYQKGYKSIYMNMSFVFNKEDMSVHELKIIGTRANYPPGPSKFKGVEDCAYTSGIVLRTDGKVDLYSGIGDCEAGRIVIDNPFSNHGFNNNN